MLYPSALPVLAKTWYVPSISTTLGSLMLAILRSSSLGPIRGPVDVHLKLLGRAAGLRATRVVSNESDAGMALTALPQRAAARREKERISSEMTLLVAEGQKVDCEVVSPRWTSYNLE